MRTRAIALACLIAGGALLTRAAAADLPGLQAAQELALRLIEETRELMQIEVKARGPAGALLACSQIALGMARVRETEGWRVRRVSLKHRNPAGAPDDYEAKVLEAFAAMKAKSELHADAEHAEVVTEDDRQYLRYMKPIILGSPVCLSCHGEPRDIPEDVGAELRRLYPEDRATGYHLADLRGAVSVKIPVQRDR